MEEIRPGVWDCGIEGHTVIVTRVRGPDWSPGVPRRPRFAYSIDGASSEAIYTCRWGAAGAAHEIIAARRRRERHQRTYDWYRKRFGEGMQETAAGKTRADMRPRLWELMDIEEDPSIPHADRLEAWRAHRMFLDLLMEAWFHQLFSEPIQEAEAETAPADKKAEKLAKLEALRDHPSTPRDEVGAAIRAIARLQGRADEEDAAA